MNRVKKKSLQHNIAEQEYVIDYICLTDAKLYTSDMQGAMVKLLTIDKRILHQKFKMHACHNTNS